METIKRIQVEANETARIMAEENAKLASQVNHYQRCGMTSGPLEATELSLQEALDREAQMKKLEVQLKQEIARLKDELFKVCINAIPYPSQTQSPVESLLLRKAFASIILTLSFR